MVWTLLQTLLRHRVSWPLCKYATAHRGAAGSGRRAAVTGSVRALPWADGAVTIGALVRTEINTALCGASHTAVAVVWWMVVRSVEIRRAGDERETSGRRDESCPAAGYVWSGCPACARNCEWRNGPAGHAAIDPQA